MQRGLVRLIVPAGLALALVGAAACGSSNNSSSKSAATNGAPVVTAVPGAGGTAQISETTTDNKFSATKYAVTAGTPVTLTVQNHGQAVHNWHVLDVKGDDGKEIKTDLTNPGAQNAVTFTISKPGTYHFQCDVHPSDMTGTLVVQ